MVLDTEMRLGIKMMVTLGLMWAHPPVKGRLRHSENTIKEQELRARREAEAYFLAYVRGRGRRRS